MRFEATHEITHKAPGDRARRIKVKLVDGVAYTRAEWDADAYADWTFTREDGLLFQGAVPLGVSSIKRIK